MSRAHNLARPAAATPGHGLLARPPARHTVSASQQQRPRAPRTPVCRQALEQGSTPGADGSRLLRPLQQGAAALLLSGALAFAAGPATAADTIKTGACLLQHCQGALARCLGDVQNIACLQYCNGRDNEAACQIRCGDLYNTPACDAFTSCAITEAHCVDQRIEEDSYAPPPDTALDARFDPRGFTGKWQISAGLNPMFDTFPCQPHYLSIPAPGKLDVRMNWRVERGGGKFSERSFVQHFEQVEGRPAVLHNGGNKFLHYEDDWYIVASKPDAYQFVFYRGDNDAWRYYGGAVVYTRAASLPEQYVPELRAAAARVGLNWDDFVLTDNSCPPAPPSSLQRAEELAAAAEQAAGRATSALERRVAQALGGVFGRPVQAAEPIAPAAAPKR